MPRVCKLLPRRSTALATNADAELLLECECAWSVHEVWVCEMETRGPCLWASFAKQGAEPVGGKTLRGGHCKQHLAALMPTERECYQ